MVNISTQIEETKEYIKEDIKTKDELFNFQRCKKE